MKPLMTIIALLLSFFSYSQTSFYVSPEGNDRFEGTKERPFRTLPRAKEAVRNELAGGLKEDITVWLGQGTYYLSEPLVFSPEDSGRDSYQVRYRALDPEKPVISGGEIVHRWKQMNNGLWTAKVRGYGDTGIRELFIDEARASRARHPNSGFLRMAKAGSDRRTNFTFYPGDIPELADLQNTEIVLLHDWSISRVPVAEIDYRGNRITAVDSIGAKSLDFFNLDGWEPHPRYFLENSLSFLDSVYEWYYDRRKELLYLKLPENRKPGDCQIVVPSVGPSLIAIKGSIGQRVKNISFEDISFQHCAWCLPEKGYAGIQACFFDPPHGYGEWEVVPAAVCCLWSDHCSFSRCDFQHLGGSGLWFATGCRDCRAEHSLFTDISGNGIMIGEGNNRSEKGDVWWKTVPEQVASGNQAYGNTVTQCGKQFFGAVGIWCGITERTLISNNQLYELPYTGISVGWEWSPTPTPCRDNHLTRNHIHHIMQLLSDGGGIYMLGLQPGSSITENLIHDVSINAGRAESNGMFLDEGTTDVVISGNIIYHIAMSPLRFHQATTNLVSHNVLSCRDGIPPVRYNSTRKEDIRLEENRILSDSDPGNREELNDRIRKWKKEQLIINY